MKLLKKVRRVDVKRTFLMTHFLRKYGIAGKRDRKIPSLEKYLKAQSKAHKAVKGLSEKQLDKIIGKWEKRLRAYNKVEWYTGEFSTNEVGVWKRAGNLPSSWTNNSLAHTAKMVRGAMHTNHKKLKKRAGRVIPIIMGLKDVIKKDKYSMPIVIERKSSPVNRRWLKKMSWDLDDGNMRSIAFAVSGDKKFKAYVGITKKNL